MIDICGQMKLIETFSFHALSFGCHVLIVSLKVIKQNPFGSGYGIIQQIFWVMRWTEHAG